MQMALDRVMWDAGIDRSNFRSQDGGYFSTINMTLGKGFPESTFYVDIDGSGNLSLHIFSKGSRIGLRVTSITSPGGNQQR